jgi:hypothetical protein
MTLEYTYLSVPEFPDMQMIVYTPAKGSVDEQKLRALVGGDANTLELAALH